MYADRLAQHIPWYPDREEDEDYNRLIMSKKEYLMHSVQNQQQHSIFFNHQRLSQIHMASHGPNRTLLLFKDPGIGKTCDAIGLAESRNEWLGQLLGDKDPTFAKLKVGKALVVSQNKATQNDTIKSDIMNTCTAGAYLTEALRKNEYQDEARRLGSETTSIQKNYELDFHEAFAGKVAQMTPETIAQRYSFRVIIIDEVHNFRSKSKVEIDPVTGQRRVVFRKDMTQSLMKFINNIYGCLIVIISATPTVDNINEFPSIINFILPRDEQIDPEEFKQISRIEDLIELRRVMEAYLVPRLRGRVSRMKASEQIKKTVVRTNQALVGRPLLRYSKTELWLSILSNNNAEYIDYTYLIEAYRKSMGSSNIYKQEIYASTMVWPGGIVSPDTKQYIKLEGVDYRFTTMFEQDFFASVRMSRTYLIGQLQKELQLLSLRQQAAPSEDLQFQIEVKQANLDVLIERSQRFSLPDIQPFDANNDSDLQILLYTIRSRYSPVFADTIQQIIGIEAYNPVSKSYEYIATARTNSFSTQGFSPDDRDNRECVYIFNEYKRHGIIPLCLFLEYFGYTPFPHGSFVDKNGDIVPQLSRGKRYALLYSTDDEREKNVTIIDQNKKKPPMSDKRIRKILEIANHPENRYGHYLKVVAGTRVTAQGINFKNIRQAHMTSRGWNEGQDIQAEGRVDRPGGSHEAFSDRDPVPVFEDLEPPVEYGIATLPGGQTQRYVKLFRHVAYYPDLNAVENGQVINQSIGLKMYDDAAYKGLKNGIPLDIAAEVSYDYTLNLRSGEVHPRPQLAFFGPGIDSAGIDYVNYNLFYARKELEQIKCQIRGFFKSFFRLSLADLLSKLQENNPDCHQSTVVKALTEMVNDNERIVDRHGAINYIREANDTFFLQKIPSGTRTREDPWLAYYSDHQFVHNPISLKTIYTAIDGAESQAALQEILSGTDGDAFARKLRGLSNRARAYVTEILVSRYRDYVGAEGKRLPAALFQKLFETLHPDVLFLAGRQMIIHIYNIKAKRELQSGGRSTTNVIPDKDEVKTKLRVYRLGENVWRDSTYAEGQVLIPFLNSYITGISTGKIREFSHWGTMRFENQRWLFSLQDKLHMAASSSLTKKEQRESRKSAAIYGQDVFTSKKEIQRWYLWGVEIDMFVLAVIYQPIQHPTIGVIKPIVLFRLQRDPAGTYDYGPVKLSLYQDPDSKEPMYVTNYPDPGQLKNHVIRNRVVRNYKHVYPEILPWLYEKEIKAMDRTFMNPKNPSFFPKSTAGEIIQLRPPPNNDDYRTLLDIVPNYGSVNIENVLIGGTGVKSGEIIIKGGNVEEFRGIGPKGSRIVQSLDLLYDYLTANLDIDVEVQTGLRKGKTEDKHIPLISGKRFDSVWVMGQHEQAIMVYLLFLFRGSINFV